MSRVKDFFKKSKSRLIFGAVSLFALFTIPTLAVVITTAHKTLSIDTSYNGKHFDTYVKQDLEGKQAFCLEPNKKNPVNLEYVESGVVDDGLYRILKYGWPNIEYTTDPDTNYFLTQLAVWDYLGFYDVNQARIRVNPEVQCTGQRITDAGSNYTGNLTKEYVIACVNDQLTAASNYQDTQSGEISVNPKNSRSKVENEYLLSEPHNIQAQGSFVNGGTLNLEFNKTVPGLKIIKNGQWFDPGQVTVAVGETVQLAVPKYTPSDTVSVKLTGTAPKKEAVRFESTNDSVQDIAIFKDRVVDASYMDAFSFTWEKAGVQGTVRVMKNDAETKEQLAGAVFGLFNEGGTKIAEATTEANGIATFSAVPVGKYKLKEIKAPANYILSTEEIDVEILDGNADVVLDFTVENTPIKHSVELTKIDSETKEVIEGAQFGIFKGEELVSQQTTDENGLVRFINLTKGDYVIKEIVPPTGYMPSDEVINVNIGDNTESQKFVYEYENEPIKFNLGVYKRESLEDIPLAGAKFRLISNGRIVYFTKPEEAEINTSLEEDTSNTETPTTDEVVPATRTGAENEEEVVEEEPTEVKEVKVEFSDVLTPDQYKTDLEDANAPEGMTSIFTTDEAGLIKFPAKLRFADFELVEIAPPAGYKPLAEPIKFSITPEMDLGEDLNDLYYEVTVENERGEGEMELTKTDVSTGELLPNAKFIIYAEDGETVVVKGVTDENGIAKFKLQTGKYFYQEYEAPVGYQIDNSLFPFEIKDDGEIVKCQMTNKKLPKTGTVPNSFPIIGAVALVVACGAFIYLRKKKK